MSKQKHASSPYQRFRCICGCWAKNDWKKQKHPCKCCHKKDGLRKSSLIRPCFSMCTISTSKQVKDADVCRQSLPLLVPDTTYAAAKVACARPYVRVAMKRNVRRLPRPGMRPASVSQARD